MTLASRITDLVTALTTVINARGLVGASDYQMWLAAGNTGDINAYRASILGADVDFATQFNTALGAVPTTKVATEAQAGLTQLSSALEVLNGTVSTKALSPANLRNSMFASNLSDLNTKAAQLSAGSLICLNQQDFSNTPSGTNNGYLYNSVWMVDVAQRVTPITKLVGTVSGALNYLASVSGTGKTYPNIFLDPYNTLGLVGSAPTRDEWMYAGATSGFILWRGDITGQLSYANGAVADRSPTLRVDGNYVDLSFGAALGSGTIPTYQQIGSVPSAYGPYGNERHYAGSVIANGAWTAADFVVQGSGAILMLQTVAAGPYTVWNFGGRYRRTIPSA